jgi:hypothetical protein
LSTPPLFFCLHHGFTAWGQKEGRVRFQNKKLKLGLSGRHTVWANVYFMRSPGGKGRVGRLGLFTCDVTRYIDTLTTSVENWWVDSDG